MTFDPAGMISDIHHILELQYESDKRKGPVSAKKICVYQVYSIIRRRLHTTNFLRQKPRNSNSQIMHIANMISATSTFLLIS